MEITKTNIAGVCIIYNENVDIVYDNIINSMTQVDKMFIVDNSDDCDCISCLRNKLKSQSNIEYISIGYNSGIAHALNVGCGMARSQGYLWVLTLDQDSFIPENMVDNYLSFINKNKGRKIGIVTCNIQCCNGDTNFIVSNIAENVEICWTSGCLTSIDALNVIKGFPDCLFIDGVDFAICAELIIHGYEIIRVNEIVMKHHLGNSIEFKIFNHHLFYVTNHSANRRYYMTRNGLYLSKKYGNRINSLKLSFWDFVKVIIKIVLFETAKVQKLKSMYMGYLDYKNGIYGQQQSS